MDGSVDQKNRALPKAPTELPLLTPCISSCFFFTIFFWFSQNLSFCFLSQVLSSLFFSKLLLCLLLGAPRRELPSYFLLASLKTEFNSLCFSPFFPLTDLYFSFVFSWVNFALPMSLVSFSRASPFYFFSSSNFLPLIFLHLPFFIFPSLLSSSLLTPNFN